MEAEGLAGQSEVGNSCWIQADPQEVSVMVLSLAAIRITWKIWKALRPGALLRTTDSKSLGMGSMCLMCFDSSPQGTLRGK